MQLGKTSKKADKKAYYAVIPASVRYDPSLSANAKLLYGEITALCSEKGFCWASNSYFAKLYEKDGRTISRWISQLIEKGYIQAEIDKEKGNQRQLFLPQSICLPIDKNVHTYRQNCPPPIDKNVHTPRTKMSVPKDKNVHHSITDNTTLNNKENKGKSSHVDLSSKEKRQHYALTLLLRYGVDHKVANRIVLDQQTPLESIEETIKNGLAKENHARENRGKFVLEPGYIVKTLNTARKEGKVVGPTKSCRDLIKRLAAKRDAKKHTQLSSKEFEKRKRRGIAALKTSV